MSLLQWFRVANKERSSEAHEDGINLHSATDSNPRRIGAWSAEISSDETVTCKNNHNGTFSHEHLKTALSSHQHDYKCTAALVYRTCVCNYCKCKLKQTHLQSNKYSKLWLVLRFNMSLIGYGKEKVQAQQTLFGWKADRSY